jgi:SulP family sulfate permease
MAKTDNNPVGFPVPVLQGMLPITAAQVPAEIIAGITLAALAIPEVMGYTKIAGTPVITGLYTILIPMALFAVFGSSRHLVVGADSATAAILAAALAGVAATGSDEYVALAAVLAFMAAGFLVLARVIGLDVHRCGFRGAAVDAVLPLQSGDNHTSRPGDGPLFLHSAQTLFFVRRCRRLP